MKRYTALDLARRAGSLSDKQPAKSAKAKRVCKKHVWRVSKYSRECSRCGVFEEKGIDGVFLPREENPKITEPRQRLTDNSVSESGA